MDQRPIFLTRYALARVLKEFARSLGFSDVMADTTAQVHLQVSPAAHNWSMFLTNNCAGCQLTPDTCTYMNPTADNIIGGATPEGTKAGVAMTIEMGKLVRCPALKS